MSYMTNGLTFEGLRGANIARIPQFKNSKGAKAHKKKDGSDWSISDWTEAVLGELGEFANFHKKFRRGDIDKKEFLKQARKELADVQIYLDILAYQMRIDLGKATKDKFNEVSERVGSDIYIGDDGDWHINQKITIKNARSIRKK